MQDRVIIGGDYLCVDHNCELGVLARRFRNSQSVYEVEIVLLHGLIVHGGILNVNSELRLIKIRRSWVVLGYLGLALSSLCLDSHMHILDQDTVHGHESTVAMICFNCA